jgi:hypothetical protein
MTVRQEERLIQSERLVRVEERVEELKETVKQLDQKMDSLLEMKNKGVGAFWLATTLIGIAISVFFSNLWHFLGWK